MSDAHAHAIIAMRQLLRDEADGLLPQTPGWPPYPSLPRSGGGQPGNTRVARPPETKP